LGIYNFDRNLVVFHTTKKRVSSRGAELIQNRPRLQNYRICSTVPTVANDGTVDWNSASNTGEPAPKLTFENGTAVIATPNSAGYAGSIPNSSDPDSTKAMRTSFDMSFLEGVSSAFQVS
jgi:hypothetical protein